VIDMSGDIILIYAVFVYMLITGFLLFWIRKDVMNKLYTYTKAGQGAKLFTLYRKDGTKDEFAACGRTGGMLKHDGDDYQITRAGVVIDRNKNCPSVTLVEGETKALNPYSKVAPRIDTKSLRALFFMEREKAAQDLNPDIKLLKMLLFVAIICCAAAAIFGFLTFQNTEGLHAVAAVAPSAASGAGVVL